MALYSRAFVGGFDLAAQWMGWENMFHCEWNEFGQKILKYYWPNAISYGDITTTDFTIHRGAIDILTGGFPCQPYSVAGKRKGKEDARHLWPEMLRAIREIQPIYVVGENVHGIINWSGGLVFNEVQADLENEGYEVQPIVLPACGVNAPHKRERVWFVAYHPNARNESMQQREHRVYGYKALTNPGLQRQEISKKQAAGTKQCDKSHITSDTQSLGVERSGADWQQEPRLQVKKGFSGCNSAGNYWSEWPTQPPICGRDDGFSSRLDGITFSKWRNESIKAYGNAIVPQVALEIFKAIESVQNKN
jgi:DNA (cytosine-5)-methyltransferase 1